MYVSGKSLAWIAPVVFTLAGLISPPAWADPVRITVDFTVTGIQAFGNPGSSDSENGNAVASGSFSIVAEAPAGGGQLENFQQGLGASSVSFTWAGTSWTRATADVPRLIFDSRGDLVYWQLAGIPSGLHDISAGTAPDIYLDPFAFLYTRAGRPGLFEGGLLSASLRMVPSGDQGQPGPDPSPVPEPASLALTASGLAALALRTKRLGRLPLIACD
jgi:hypothetical protein